MECFFVVVVYFLKRLVFFVFMCLQDDAFCWWCVFLFALYFLFCSFHSNQIARCLFVVMRLNVTFNFVCFVVSVNAGAGWSTPVRPV